MNAAIRSRQRKKIRNRTKTKQMGWKISTIIIENKNNLKDDNTILEALGKSNFEFKEELILDYDIVQSDNSICIGYYLDNIILFDDYQITTKSLERANGLKLIKEEKRLIDLFPNAEILTAACHSSVNYHGYSLIKNGEKVRLKTISSEEKLRTFGERIEEEIEIYKTSYQENGANYWKDENYPDDNDYTEDQLMEDFTFGVAKRRLGFRLDSSEADELMETVVFKKYIHSDKTEITDTETEIFIDTTEIETPKNKWRSYSLIFLVIILWQVLKWFYFRN